MSSEQAARRMYDDLSAADQRLVLRWREGGHDWSTSLLRSGVLSARGPRTTPEQAAREEANAQFEQYMLDRDRRVLGLNRRQETAEHEAAHVVVASALGLRVDRAHICADNDSEGNTAYVHGTPYQAAMVALAGEIWVGLLRSLEFPAGARGCRQDRRDATRALPDPIDLERAYRDCFDILRRSYRIVLDIAAKIDREGEFRP